MNNSSLATDTAVEIISMERAALDRWGKGDPSGFLEISAPDVVYFDPFLDHRIDGWDALAAHYEPVRGKVDISRYEMDNANVQFAGDAAVLTFNFVSYGGTEDAFRWNCTEVYRRSEGKWAIIQTHWAFTRGERPAA
ncbi:MAG: nuclear transport factor 2 family protein [Vicinamibacteria bacterium]